MLRHLNIIHIFESQTIDNSLFHRIFKNVYIEITNMYEYMHVEGAQL